jgi:hypothetical protein
MSLPEKLNLLNQIVSWLVAVEAKVVKLPPQKYMTIGYKFVFGHVPYVIALKEDGNFKLFQNLFQIKKLRSNLTK